LEFPIHQGAITNIQITHNYQYLITSSQDGSIFYSKIKEVKDGNEISSYDILKALTAEDNKKNVSGKLTNTYFLSNFLLINDQAMKKKNSDIEDLEVQIQ
jgi:hypothetical protein